MSGTATSSTSPATTSRRDDRLADGSGRYTADLRLAVCEPFTFEISLAFIRAFPAMTGQQGVGSGVLTLALRETGLTLGARLTAAPASEGGGLDCRLVCDQPIGEAARKAAADRLDFFLGLSDDLTEFYEAARGDAAFARVVQRLYGYHQVKFPSPTELLVWAILCQRVPIPVARAMKKALMDHFGNTVLLDVPWQAFPDLAQLSELSEAQLYGLIGNQRKAGYLARSLEQWRALDEEFLRRGPYEQVQERLLALPGIGPWSASFLMIRGLGRTEQVTLDKEMASAARRVYGRPMDQLEFSELAQRYGRWRGYWGHYLRVAG